MISPLILTIAVLIVWNVANSVLIWHTFKKTTEKHAEPSEKLRDIDRRMDRLDIDLTDLSDKTKKFINRERTRAAREAKENNAQDVEEDEDITPINDKMELRRRLMHRGGM